MNIKTKKDFLIVSYDNDDKQLKYKISSKYDDNNGKQVQCFDTPFLIINPNKCLTIFSLYCNFIHIIPNEWKKNIISSSSNYNSSQTLSFPMAKNSSSGIVNIKFKTFRNDIQVPIGYIPKGYWAISQISFIS